MKTMKRFLAAVIAVTSVMAIAPISAFAENETGGTTTVLFNAVIEPAYTITIPASVELSDTETATATIKAEEVYLDTTKHKQINVTLDSASHTQSGSTFHAENDKGDSTATYTINGGDVAVGGVVATFTEDDSKDLTFSTASGATYAGTHTETLTFGITVENAVTTKTVIFNTDTDGKTINKEGVTCNANFDASNNFAMVREATFSVASGNFTKIEITADGARTLCYDNSGKPYDGWSYVNPNAIWEGKASNVLVGKVMGNKKPVTIVFTIEE